MKKDNVFEAYAKIMAEKSKLPEHNEQDLAAPGKGPVRMDSLTIEEINKLYNLKPPSPKEMEYKNNIFEISNKEPLIIYPAHDKINGLLENENEGQNIRLRITRKNPDGQLDARKFAKKNLMLSLVSLANLIDARDLSTEMYKLADTCLTQVANPSRKQFTKLAFWPALLGVAAVFGAIYAKNHLPFHSDGWNQDYQKAISEINDLINSNDNLGVGYTYSPQFIQLVNKLQSILSLFNDKVNSVLSILDTIQSPHTTTELIELAKQPETQDTINKIKDFKASVIQVDTFLRKIISDFQDPTYKSRAIVEKGFLTSLIDSSGILHGGKGLVADDLDDVAHALETLQGDVSNILDGLKKADSLAQDFVNELQESQSSLEPHMEKETPISNENEENVQKNQSSGENNDEFDQFLKNI